MEREGRGWTLDQAARKSGMGELTVEPGPPSLPPPLPPIHMLTEQTYTDPHTPPGRKEPKSV